MSKEILRFVFFFCLVALFFVFAPKSYAAGCAGTGACYWVGGLENDKIKI